MTFRGTPDATDAPDALPFSGLSGRALSVVRGGRPLFGDVSFDAGPGDLVRLTGPNGSGKSSLIRALLGLVPLQAGSLALGGLPVRPRDLCAHALYQGHSPAAKPEFTAIENLALAAGLDGSPTATATLADALGRVGLGRHLTIEARRLSQGQRQRLQLARFVLPNARRLWLMDEPSAALDAEGARLLEALVAAHLAGGGAAIVATHLPVGEAITGARTVELGRRSVPRMTEAA
jgi:heme exporter protein A